MKTAAILSLILTLACADAAIGRLMADPHAPAHASPAAPAAAPSSNKISTPARTTPAPKAAAPEHATTPKAETPGAPSPKADPHAPAKTEPKATAPATKPSAQVEGKPTKAPAKADKPEKPEPAKAPEAEATDADTALNLLMEGNQRWVDGVPTAPNTSAERRANVADAGQTPMVSVLTCADSRLPIERIFDRGVGDVFVIRVAGNIAGDSEIGTIEYGVGHLKTPLLVVMGHSKCGAVAAAVSNADVHGKVKALIAHIEPAVVRVKRNNPGATDKELGNLAIKENVWQSVFDLLKGSAEVRTLVQDGKLKIVGAVCDISTGKVTWLGEHPWQSELLDAMASGAPSKHEAHGDAASAPAPAATGSTETAHGEK
jgi:carbonic anhydrase